MGDFIDNLEGLLNKSGNVSLRDLEKKVRDRFGEDARVSKSLINNYLKRKTVPTYNAVYQLAVALDLDVKRVLANLYEYRKQCGLEKEAEAYMQFIKSAKL